MEGLKQYRKIQERKYNLIMKYKNKANVLIELDPVKRSLYRLMSFAKKYVIPKQQNLQFFQLDSIPGKFRMKMKINKDNLIKPVITKPKTTKSVNLSNMSFKNKQKSDIEKAIKKSEDEYLKQLGLIDDKTINNDDMDDMMALAIAMSLENETKKDSDETKDEKELKKKYIIKSKDDDVIVCIDLRTYGPKPSLSIFYNEQEYYFSIEQISFENKL